MNHLATGQSSEAKAKDYLISQGVQIIAQNFQTRFGELDLIALDNKTLVFVEVRFRQHGHWGGAAASVTQSKQRKLINTADLYLQMHPKYRRYRCRFDVIAMNKNSLDWIKNAFESS